jgi:undecaprenyl-diphosphatase
MRFSGSALRFSSIVGTFFLAASVLIPQGAASAADTLRQMEGNALLALRHGDDLSTPIGPHWFVNYFVNWTSLGSMAVLATLTVVLVIYFLKIGRRAEGLYVLSCLVSAWIASTLLKIAVNRPRPDVVPHLVPVNDASFPSGHSTDSMAIYLGIAIALSFIRYGRIRPSYPFFAAAVLIALVGMSRIYLGVHFPSDVLGGWVLGAACAYLCYLVLRRLSPRPIA